MHPLLKISMHDTLTNIKKTPSHSDSSDISSTTAPTGVLLLSWLFVVVQLYVDGSYGRFVFNIPNPFVRHMHVPYRSYRQSTQKHRRSMRHPAIPARYPPTRNVRMLLRMLFDRFDLFSVVGVVSVVSVVGVSSLIESHVLWSTIAISAVSSA